MRWNSNLPLIRCAPSLRRDVLLRVNRAEPVLKPCVPPYLFAGRLLRIAWSVAPRMSEVVAGNVAERPDCGHLAVACGVVVVVHDGRAWRLKAMFDNDWPWWSFGMPRMRREVPTHNTLPVKTILVSTRL